MKWHFQVLLWTTVTLLTVVESPAAEAASCTTAWTQQIRDGVLPRWAHVRPDELAQTWPGRLRKTAEGSASTWAELRDDCAIYFMFAPASQNGPQLSSIRVTVLGARGKLLSDARLFAQVFGPGLRADEIAELNEHHRVITTSRTPPDLTQPGRMKVRTVSLSPERPAQPNSRWILEVMYDEFADPPVR